MNGTNGKSWKREVAGVILLFAAVVSFKFWNLADAALITAFAPAYNNMLLVVVPSALAVFGLHFWRANPADATKLPTSGARPVPDTKKSPESLGGPP